MDEQHWRERAEEIRAIANRLNDPEAKRLMKGLAVSYERLALHAALHSPSTGSAPRASQAASE
jgi:hypothetical protein